MSKIYSTFMILSLKLNQNDGGLPSSFHSKPLFQYNEMNIEFKCKDKLVTRYQNILTILDLALSVVISVSTNKKNLVWKLHKLPISFFSFTVFQRTSDEQCWD